MNDLTTNQPRNSIMSTVPLLDPLYFQQVQAIASMMANSSIIPRGLLYEKDANNKEVAIPIDRVTANCFLIANQAMKWGMEPFGVAQSCSIVHGRLMFEGKLVAAVLDANLGVKLHYEFGKWDGKTQTCDVAQEGTGDDLGVRVYEFKGFDDDGNLKFSSRYVDGCVGAWKTTGNNSPWAPANYRRQLRYRGAREWARAFEPGIMIGVITDDEIDFDSMRDITPASDTPARSTASDVIDRLKQAKGGEASPGFDAERVNADTASKSTAKDKPSQDLPKTGSNGTKTDTGQADLLGAADNKDANVLTEYDSKWLLNSARMMMAPTKPGADLSVLQTQRKVVSEEYPFADVNKRAIDKLKSVIDYCVKIAKDEVDPDDAAETIAGIVGTTVAELKKQAEKI